MMPAEGFEPPTYGLQNRCTTTVLSRHMEMHTRTSPARILPQALPPRTARKCELSQGRKTGVVAVHIVIERRACLHPRRRRRTLRPGDEHPK